MSIFHRYKSTIHGNYRRAYLRGGLITGSVLAAYLLLRLLMQNPAASPTSYITDAVVIVLVVLLMAYYRRSLPDGKITLKEAMLFGMGTAVVGAAVYGVCVWLMCLVVPAQAALFTTTLTPNPTEPTDPQIGYWAAWWGVYAAILMALLGSFAAFVAALFFRNEKSDIKSKNK